MLPPTVMVRVELPLQVPGWSAGRRSRWYPGAPAADRLIELLNPPLMVVVMLEVP